MSKVITRKANLSETKNGLEFVLSSERPDADRYGDIIHVQGIDLRNFERNPIALFNHDSSFPIGKWANLRAVGGKLRGDLHLMPAGTSSRIDEIRALLDEKVLRACSIGFRVLESSPLNNGSYLYSKTELAEVSVVSVPANVDALMLAKSHGVSNATITKIFRENRNAPMTLNERIAENKRAVRIYNKQERDRIHAKALAILAKRKSKPKLLEMSETAKAKTAHNRASLAKAKALLKKAKERDYLERRDPVDPRSTNPDWFEHTNMWQGEKTSEPWELDPRIPRDKPSSGSIGPNHKWFPGPITWRRRRI